MNKIDLKKLWSDTHINTEENICDELSFRKSLKMSHSKIMTKVLFEFKLKIIGYFIVLIILTGLIIYALLYLKLNLSANTLMLFSYIGLFFVLQIISVIKRIFILTKTDCNLSFKDSILLFQRRLNRIKVIDFVSYLIYFNLFAFLVAYNYIHDIDGIKNLSWDNKIQSLVLIAIVMLLSVPWLIKYQNNNRYKRLNSSLNDSVNYLEEE